MATREFLNLLTQTKPANKVPFIYVSDHDVGGWQIYRTLRYGSAREAWLSLSQCCPKLEFWGVTTGQYLDLIDNVKELKLKDFAASNKDWDNERCKTEVSSWVEQRKAHFHQQCSSTIPDCDATRLVNLRELLGVEPRLGQEIRQMIQSKKGRFGCAMLNELRSGGQELFLLEAVDQRLLSLNQQNIQSRNTLRELLPPHPSSDTVQFNAIESQSQGVAEDEIANRLRGFVFI